MKTVTEMVLTIHHEDRLHITALLSRFNTWGMLNYYDMDTIFHGVEELSHAFFMVMPQPSMNWRSFCIFLEELAGYEEHPLKHLRTATFLLVGIPSGTACFDFRLLKAVVENSPA